MADRKELTNVSPAKAEGAGTLERLEDWQSPRCPICSKVFASVAGMGVHASRSHREAWNKKREQEAASRPPVKARWSHEEVALMARSEVDIVARGTLEGTCYSGQEISVELSEMGVFGHRSLGAIKGKRKSKAYKALVERLRETKQQHRSPRREQQAPRLEEDPQIHLWRNELASVMWSIGGNLEQDYQSWLGDLGLRVQHKSKPNLTSRPFHPPDLKLLSKKKYARQMVAYTRRRFERNRNITIASLRKGTFAEPLVDQVTSEEKARYWSEVFSKPSVQDIRTPEAVRPPDWTLIRHITEQEVSEAIRGNATAAGPDGITWAMLSKVPYFLTAALLNRFLHEGDVPTSLKQGRTTLIPKIQEPKTAGDFRPITVTSTVLRTFHKIIASRMRDIPISTSLKGYQPLDGCAQNVWLVGGLLDLARKRKNSLALAFLDVAKAFDSVSHQTLLLACERVGVPKPFRLYLECLYKGAHTDVEGVRTPFCSGILQGDPLSGYLFNFVMDWAQSMLPKEIGYAINSSVRVNLGAYADDTFLAASTKLGLQSLVDTFATELGKAGLRLNSQKCATISVIADRKRKTYHISETPSLIVDGKLVRALPITTAYKYLGVDISPSGVDRVGPEKKLQSELDNIKGCKLKPQQKVAIIRDHVIPALNHSLVLSDITVNKLVKLDTMIRGSIRSILKIFHDTPNSFLHSRIADGGLGIPCLATSARRLRRKRLMRLSSCGDPVIEALMAEGGARIDRLRRELILEGEPVNSADHENSIHRRVMLQKVDTKGLVEAQAHPASSSWVRNDRLPLSGGDFIKAINVRCAGLATKAKLARHNGTSNRCSSCADAVANLGHLLQVCPRTHGARIKRHDQVEHRLVTALNRAKYRTKTNNRFQTQDGLLKPDIIAWRDDRILVVDPTIVADNANMSGCALNKTLKYGGDRLKEQVIAYVRSKDQRGSNETYTVEVIPAVINWRGIWHPPSYHLLRAAGLSANSLSYCAIQTLVGGHMIWRINNQRTDGSSYKYINRTREASKKIKAQHPGLPCKH